MSIPKEPRQLMINLMYLVLTALLALNVSREVLNAFANINKSINRSNSFISVNNAATVSAYDAELAKGRKYSPEKEARIKQGKELSSQVHEKTMAIIKELEGYRNEIISKSGGYALGNNGELKAPEDINAATAIMVEGPKKGDLMKANLLRYKDELVALVPSPTDSGLYFSSPDQASLKEKLPINFDVTVNDENKGDWKYANFFQVPTIGAITVIDKYINDVHTAEAMAQDQIWAAAFGEVKDKNNPIVPQEDNHHKDEVKKEDFIEIFNQYTAIARPSANYVLPNERFNMDIMIGAYTDKPDSRTQLRVNGVAVPIKNGIANFSEIAKGTTDGQERILNVTGAFYDPNTKSMKELKPYKVSYFIGMPSATISLDAMNVMYREVDNPLTATANGILLKNLTLTPSAGIALTPTGPGKYTADPAGVTGATATISLKGLRGDGTYEDFGTKTYRIKNVPLPIMKVGGKSGGSIRADIFRLQLGPEASMPEDFVFAFKYTVESFTFGYTLRKTGEYDDIDNVGPLFNSKILDVMKRLKPKDKVYIENIRVKTPKGTIRSIPGSLVFTMI